MKTPLLAVALVLAVGATAAAAPPATSPSPRAALQADPAAVAQILAVPAAAPTPAPVFLATGAPSDWTLAVCPSIPAGCCEFAWNGSCMYCLVFDPTAARNRSGGGRAAPGAGEKRVESALDRR